MGFGVSFYKSKYCVKINIEQERSVALFPLIPELGKLCSTQQEHILLVSNCGYFRIKQ